MTQIIILVSSIDENNMMYLNVKTHCSLDKNKAHIFFYYFCEGYKKTSFNDLFFFDGPKKTPYTDNLKFVLLPYDPQ